MNTIKLHSVYCLLFPNQKKYVGYTSRNVKARLLEHRCNASLDRDYPLYHAIRKHPAFRILILGRYTSKEQALSSEKHYIKLYRSTTTDGSGYNITTGGEGVNGYRPSDADKKASGDRLKSLWLNPEKRKSLIAKLKGKVTWNKGLKTGSFWDENSDKKRKESLRKNGTYAGKPKKSIIITNIENKEGLEFDSISSAAKFFGTSSSGIINALKGRSKSYKNYTARYKEGI